MRRLKIAALIATSLTSFLLVFIPAYLIRPFVAQSPQGLTVAYFLRSLNPWTTLGLCLVGGVLVLSLWRASHSGIARGALGVGALVLLGSAVMSRQNHFEWMFQPMQVPGFVSASKADHVTGSDMVLGIRLREEARAYPVRIMAYHHVVNDVVAGQPVVVTY